MNKFCIFILFCLHLCISAAQSFSDITDKHREAYISHLLEDENSPIAKKSIKYLRFFPADSLYRVYATCKLTPDEVPFSMPTSNGKMKQYIKYGTLEFMIHDTLCTLSIYQNISLRETEAYADYLFIPFYDGTNGDETYGGGRYIDLRKSDINNNTVILDFNTCYNPYCVYSDGYSCPVPPAENKLPVSIYAGEKMFAKKAKN